MPFQLTKEFIITLKEIINEKDEKKAISLINELHPADIAEIYDEISIEEAKFLYFLLDGEKAADVLVELEEDDREKFLRAIPSEQIARQFIHNMDSDDAADVIGEMSAKDQEEILAHITDVDQAGDIVDLLNYDEDTAGGLMAKELVVVNENWTVEKCITEVKKQVESVDEVYYVYVINDDSILKGTVSLKNLLIKPNATKISKIYNSDIISVRTDTESEAVANIMEKYDLVALPVIDSIGRLMGRITIDDVVDVIREEAEKDYQMASGISEDIEPTDKVLVLSRARLPWLLIGLAGGIMGALVLGGYHELLTKYAGIVLFLPLIAAMAGNVGVQSSAIIVQGLANKSIGLTSTGKRLSKEFLVALLNGLILSFILFIFSTLYNKNFNLTLTISVSLFAVIIFASFFGTLIPLLLNRFKIDPAVATGPFITTLNDIMGLFIYLITATIIYNAFPG
ncbi:magnesium transporter [Bacteroidota bacterium]